MFTSQSLALLLLVAQSSLASPIVQPVVIRSLANATGPPPKGPNRYAALGTFDSGSSEAPPLESKELHDFFEEEQLVAPGMAIGEPITESLPAATSEVEEPKPTSFLSSLVSGAIFAQPTIENKLQNPKYTGRRRPRPQTTVKPVPSAAPVVPRPPPAPTGCFPYSRTDIPTTPATADSLKQWWCDEKEDYAFLG